MTHRDRRLWFSFLWQQNAFGATADAASKTDIVPMLTIHHSAIELKDNTVIVVLGASGDLAKKKTVCCQRRKSFKHQLTNFLQFPALFGLVSYDTTLPPGLE